MSARLSGAPRAQDDLVRARLRAAGARDRPVELAAWPLSLPARLLRASLVFGAAAILRLFAPIEVVGREHLQLPKAPVLLVANHSSHLDTAAILAVLPAHLRHRLAVAAAEDYFFDQPWLGATVRLLVNAFPIRRLFGLRTTLRECRWLRAHDWSILLFPEGTRSLDGQMAEFKAGIGLLAVELGIHVLPVHIHGVFAMLPKGQRWPQRGRMRVSFGPPLLFGPHESYASATAAIEHAVRDLALPVRPSPDERPRQGDRRLDDRIRSG
ncbi:MAG TPA: lysophospholipid acyltransferase family protein [Chloroflexota bacterium]|nr:lysophospholipid acyltransferase family protein [Chloroflexota bacterium]